MLNRGREETLLLTCDVNRGMGALLDCAGSDKFLFGRPTAIILLSFFIQTEHGNDMTSKRLNRAIYDDQLEAIVA